MVNEATLIQVAKSGGVYSTTIFDKHPTDATFSQTP
jgi:hypothetical protein